MKEARVPTTGVHSSDVLALGVPGCHVVSSSPLAAPGLPRFSFWKTWYANWSFENSTGSHRSSTVGVLPNPPGILGNLTRTTGWSGQTEFQPGHWLHSPVWQAWARIDQADLPPGTTLPVSGWYLHGQSAGGRQQRQQPVAPSWFCVCACHTTHTHTHTHAPPLPCAAQYYEPAPSLRVLRVE